MATGDSEKSVGLDIVQEFESWQEETSYESIFLLESKGKEDGSVCLALLLGSEYEFKMLCPAGYPNHEGHFYVEAGPAITIWANSLNEFLLDSTNTLTLAQVLDKAAALYNCDSRCSSQSDEGSEEDMEFEDEDDVLGLSDDDSAFTTEWELKMARKKKRWAQKENEIREELKKSRLVPAGSELGALQATLQETQQAKQIFTSSAASGILTNDLVKIMESEESIGITADPVDDNIYQWCVTLFNFNQSSDLAKDLADVDAKFGYNYIELQLDFAIDLYPFYPPLVKVMRPRLQNSMMQRVTNMEILKLSYWNPAKNMHSVLVDIKHFLQQWARLEVNNERNDRKRYPHGSYVDIEHYLLRLALVSEVNPRANIRYYLEVDPTLDMKYPSEASEKCRKKGEEYWAAGVGYGHSRRPGWDVKAYLAAQNEKDKQIEAVLQKILIELKKLYANHAPQLKPRSLLKPHASCQSESVDPVEDMYHILEGSALIPFLEQTLRADSFLEICRHTAVFKAIVDIIKEIVLQPQLVLLLGTLPDQSQSVYELLGILEQKANILLQHICKSGNGSIPKPPKKEPPVSRKSKDKGGGASPTLPSLDVVLSTSERSAEERLARSLSAELRSDNKGTTKERMWEYMIKDHIKYNVFTTLEAFHVIRDFRPKPMALLDAFSRAGMQPEGIQGMREAQEAEVMDISISTDETAQLETRYKKALSHLQFDTYEMELTGPNAHRYASNYKSQPTPSKDMVFRIAQEVTSLSSSLPIALTSSIFVRTDDEKLTLMRALITGPEGTPYSGGCYQFEIFFPTGYPKVPPLVNLQTTGGGTVRFNPNLYNCGKVCLSLLGTWEGQQGEQWNDKTSTVLQVLVSIQSLILVAEPYFNEPGFEQEIGTEAGKKHSDEYNGDVKINNIKYAMIAQLQKPSPGLEDVIRTHFYLKKDVILQEVEGWQENSKSSKLERAVQNLRQELQKLEPPPNLANLCLTSRDSPKPEQI